jgi:hypothetical protein
MGRIHDLRKLGIYLRSIRMKPVNIILKGTLTKSYLPKTGEKEVVSL